MLHERTPIAIQIETHLARENAGGVREHGVRIESPLDTPVDGPIADTLAGYNRYYSKGGILVVSMTTRNDGEIEDPLTTFKDSIPLGPDAKDQHFNKPFPQVSELDPVKALERYFWPRSSDTGYRPQLFLYTYAEQFAKIRSVIQRVADDPSCRNPVTAVLLSIALEETTDRHHAEDLRRKDTRGTEAA